MQQSTSGALLDAVRGVHWHARSVVHGVFQGGHRSKRVGASPEFSSYRPYQQGDDPAKIDWKLFGRTERVSVRLSHDESSLRTSILVDASASMAYPEGTLAKWELAAAVALGLSAVAYGDHDPIGLAVVDGSGPRVLPPRTRRDTVASILRALSETSPGGSTPLAPLLPTLQSSRRIVIVSDFLGDADDLLTRARELVVAGREIHAVHVVAREELDPRTEGSVVTDPELPSLRRPLDDGDIVEYQKSFAAWRESLAADWRAAGVSYNLATTEELADRVVRRVAAPIAQASDRA